MATNNQHRGTAGQRRQQTLCRIRKESDRALLSQHVMSDDLQIMAYLAKVAPPRARSISWRGIRFPLRQGFAINSVLDPETGRPLVGALAI